MSKWYSSSIHVCCNKVNVNCCNSGLNSVFKIIDVSHWSPVHTVFYISTQEKITGCDIRWTGWSRDVTSMSTPLVSDMLIKRCTHIQGPVWWCTILLEEHSMLQFLYLWTDKVFQHIQVTAGCHSGFSKEKGANQMIIQQTTPYINFWAVSNVSHSGLQMCRYCLFPFPEIWNIVLSQNMASLRYPLSWPSFCKTFPLYLNCFTKHIWIVLMVESCDMVCWNVFWPAYPALFQ